MYKRQLYNGANGSVKGLQAAMLNDGTAMAVYTLDRSGAENGSGQEIGYTIVDKDGNLGTSMLVTSDDSLDENPQVAALSLHLTSGMFDQRFILGWHSQREGVSDIQLLAVDGNGVMSNTFPASDVYKRQTWSSSDTDIATITTEDDYSGKVTLTGQKVGEVTFTFTADNGTPEDDSDDKTGKSQTYTVVAGESIALVIPQGASTIVVRQKAAATVLWSSNASQFAPGADFQLSLIHIWRISTAF